MRAILADTGPLYARVDPEDGRHARARGEIGRIAEAGFRIVVPYPVLLEAHSLILRRRGVSVALEWLARTRRQCGLLNPTSRHYAAAAEALTNYDDQPISLFDAVTARLSREFGFPVWTYDHHFDVMGVQVWQDG